MSASTSLKVHLRTFVFVLEVAMIAFYAIFVTYDDNSYAKRQNNETNQMDNSIWMAFNFLTATFAIQWTILIQGFFQFYHNEICAIFLATEETYRPSMYQTFSHNSPSEGNPKLLELQKLIAGLKPVNGVLTGLVNKLPFMASPSDENCFDDQLFFDVASDFDSAEACQASLLAGDHPRNPFSTESGLWIFSWPGSCPRYSTSLFKRNLFTLPRVHLDQLSAPAEPAQPHCFQTRSLPADQPSPELLTTGPVPTLHVLSGAE
ncbi:hypothetical protein CRENBAI_013958 [Crenichthys baileyi]|uniref:Uncharacterized protein n=1 Tax=Crenichthys baileyi TaxID=28760 RepID=A0AAV9RF07_9TELE